MTLLQKAVLVRLREAGYNGMADAAKDCWTHGEAVNMPNMVSERQAVLRADYERANSQVNASIEDRLSDRELYLKLDVPIVPQPGHLVYVEDADKALAIATVGNRISVEPPRFDVTLVDGCRAVALWTPAGEGRGSWHAISKGPPPSGSFLR